MLWNSKIYPPEYECSMLWPCDVCFKQGIETCSVLQENITNKLTNSDKNKSTVQSVANYCYTLLHGWPLLMLIVHVNVYRSPIALPFTSCLLKSALNAIFSQKRWCLLFTGWCELFINLLSDRTMQHLRIHEQLLCVLQILYPWTITSRKRKNNSQQSFQSINY